MTPPRLYLLDVEGTIAPVSLVTEQLFPYARKHLADFLTEHFDNAAVQTDLLLLAVESKTETEKGAPRIPDSAGTAYLQSPDFQVRALVYLNWLMESDRKSTALKSLQGKIWKAGFESGELKGTLFPDVPPALARWQSHAQVAIYSSGSTAAQKLLFRHSIYGDLTPRISAYYDTRTGPKNHPASYLAIASATGVLPAEVLFLSDVTRELDPARAAGLQTRLVVREGNAPIDNPNGHATIQSFDSL
jgi:enolase-phosphatase E1